MRSKIEITSIEDAPEWMIDNRYLFHGYRKNFNCLKSSVRSLFLKHNETMNVWTHLLAAIIFVICMSYLIVNFENTRTVYQEIKNDLNFDRLSVLMKESSAKIASSFKELDFQHNMQTLTENLEKIKQTQLKFLEETRAQFIDRELAVVKAFNSQIDKLSKQAEHFFENCVDHYRTLKSKSEDNFHEFSHLFDHMTSGRNIVNAFERVLNSELEFYPVILYFLSAITCLGFSAIFHLFYVMNPRICKILQKLDYAGIAILIFGSSFNIYFYYFYCRPTLYATYCISIGVACLTVFLIAMSDWIEKPEYSTFKGMIWGLLGLTNLIPISNIIYLNWVEGTDPRSLPLADILGSLIAETAFYLGGLAIYIVRFPERCFPKKFDIWLNSHTVWHLCVVGGAVSHLTMTLRLYNLRNEHHCF